MNLVDKYNIAAPRYTSYPTVPYWDNNLTIENWKQKVRESFHIHKKNGISLYIHLPFCESLCTYCACNTRITVNHKVEGPYIKALLAEWKLYLELFSEKPVLKEIHLGGGTPTFFSPANLSFLLSEILKTVEIAPDHDFSFEGHPANTTREHLEELYEHGFRRVSFGIQDFDDKIQDTINRYQSFEQVKNVIQTAREIGYNSVNVDLVYGLPHQTLQTIDDTIEKVNELKPDRIAFYSYAHVPWLKPGQRKYSEKDLPASEEKRKLYELGREKFIRAGYEDIGMDHFSLASDSLFKSYKAGKLHRNFMGYTSQATNLLIGLGCSSISDSWTAFSQNIKSVEEYIAAVEKGEFPVHKGHVLTEKDLIIRKQILDLMCRNNTELLDEQNTKEKFSEFISDGLAETDKNYLHVTEKGRPFVRNICLALDERYWANQPSKNIFSTTA